MSRSQPVQQQEDVIDLSSSPAGQVAVGKQRSERGASQQAKGKRRGARVAAADTVSNTAQTSGSAAAQDVFVDLTSSPDDDDCTVHSASFSPSKRHRLSAAAAAGPSSALTQQVAASAAAELQGQAEAEMRRPQCSVCMDDIKDMMCPPCGHVFCGECLKASIKLQKKCPSCRKNTTLRNIHRVFVP
ncbi:hypothetical protein WJX84_009518 [Apatococcus fuscideae]|uniref:RING-type domain-containing protein n=1 Tax=Apatococcus fuscideae TaxID=2026836 RepID=A0AAW1T4L7_9CHLO